MKLASSDFLERKGLIVIAFEHTPPKIHVELLVQCFEHISQKVLKIPLKERNTQVIPNLIHPVHQQCTIYGWELGKFDLNDVTPLALVTE